MISKFPRGAPRRENALKRRLNIIENLNVPLMQIILIIMYLISKAISWGYKLIGRLLTAVLRGVIN